MQATVSDDPQAPRYLSIYLSDRFYLAYLYVKLCLFTGFLSVILSVNLSTSLSIYFYQIKSNQITFIVTSPQHKCLGEWNSYERAPDSAEKQQTIYIWTDSAKKQQTIYIWTDSAKNCTGAFTVLQTVQKTQQQQFTYGQTVQKATAIYIWTVHIYRLYRRQCAKYTYIYSVHIVYYKDILNYQRHIIHRMGTSALCTVSIHNVVYA